MGNVTAVELLSSSGPHIYARGARVSSQEEGPVEQLGTPPNVPPRPTSLPPSPVRSSPKGKQPRELERRFSFPTHHADSRRSSVCSALADDVRKMSVVGSKETLLTTNPASETASSALSRGGTQREGSSPLGGVASNSDNGAVVSEGHQSLAKEELSKLQSEKDSPARPRQGGLGNESNSSKSHASPDEQERSRSATSAISGGTTSKSADGAAATGSTVTRMSSVLPAYAADTTPPASPVDRDWELRYSTRNPRPPPLPPRNKEMIPERPQPKLALKKLPAAADARNVPDEENIGARPSQCDEDDEASVMKEMDDMILEIELEEFGQLQEEVSDRFRNKTNQHKELEPGVYINVETNGILVEDLVGESSGKKADVRDTSSEIADTEPGKDGVSTVPQILENGLVLGSDGKDDELAAGEVAKPQKRNHVSESLEEATPHRINVRRNGKDLKEPSGNLQVSFLKPVHPTSKIRRHSTGDILWNNGAHSGTFEPQTPFEKIPLNVGIQGQGQSTGAIKSTVSQDPKATVGDLVEALNKMSKKETTPKIPNRRADQLRDNSTNQSEASRRAIDMEAPVGRSSGRSSVKKGSVGQVAPVIHAASSKPRPKKLVIPGIFNGGMDSPT